VVGLLSAGGFAFYFLVLYVYTDVKSSHSFRVILWEMGFFVIVDLVDQMGFP
jgi:hypothetical protein